MNLTATFSLTDREYRSLIRHSPAMRHFAAASLILALIGALVLLFGGSMVLLVFGLGMLILLESLVVYRAARKFAAGHPGPWTLELTEEAYVLRTPSDRFVVAWSAFRSVGERGGFWFLGTSGITAEAVPKRVFDKHQQAVVTAFLARRLPPARRPWYRLFA
ncbi:YcxB family protein [Streptomyces sp. NPDC021080]|uniref:YcxB family protein n=1 Tax=Streptomyces sp. NPDC021080 TaxID=3365110 RepID=UPI00378F4BE0